MDNVEPFSAESTGDLRDSDWAANGGQPIAHSLSRVHYRNHRGQLQIDHKVDMAVDLVPQRSLLGGYDLLKNWNIPQAQCEQLLVKSRSSLDVILRLRISHRVVIRSVLLD